MNIYFSNNDFLRTFRSFLESVNFSKENILKITTHNKWTNVHPAGLVLAAALALKAGKQNSWIDQNVPVSVGYLDRMGLYNYLSTTSPFSHHEKEPTGRFIPITVVKTDQDQSRFISDMIPLLHLPPDKSDIIKYIVGELIRNVLEHAQAKHGAIVAAQYFPKSNRISIGICDTGIGIWRSMHETWQPKNDIEAIKMALTPGITGTTRREGGTSDNAGAGLFFIKSIAKMARSYFVIYSGRGEYSLLKYDKRVKTLPRLYADPELDHHRESNALPNFQGTLIGVDISLDSNAEFNSILEAIKKAYEESIRDRKRLRYKEPKFI